STKFAPVSAALLAGTMLSGMPAMAQTAPEPAAQQPAAPAADSPAATPTATPTPAPTRAPAAARTPARAARTPATPAAPAAAQAATPAVARTIKTLRVEGSQRIEPETVLSYTKLRVGIPYTAETLDQALKDLQASDLFVDFSISGVETGDIVLRI